MAYMQPFPSTGGRFSDDLCLEMPSRSGAWVPQGFWAGWLWVWGHPIASYTLILFGTQIHTKVSIFGAICFDQQHDQSLDPVNSCRFRQLRHQKHCLEILDVIQYSGHKLASECPLRYFVGGTGIWGFVDMSATKRVQQTPESVFPQLLLPYSPPTLDKYLGRRPWFVPVFGVPVKSWVSPYLGKNRG